MAATLTQLKNTNNKAYKRALAYGTADVGGVNAKLTERIARLPNLTAKQRCDMFADAVVTSQIDSEKVSVTRRLKKDLCTIWDFFSLHLLSLQCQCAVRT